MLDRQLPDLFTHCFLRAAEAELGPYCLKLLLRSSNLLSGPFETQSSTTFQESAWKTERSLWISQYALLLTTIHVYYGTGARTILTRIGRRIWNLFLKDAHLGQRSNLLALRILPPMNRRVKCLEQVAALMHHDPGEIKILAGESELIWVDTASAAAFLEHLPNPTFCWLTQGLVEEALFWVCGSASEVEETDCLAAGAPACRFRIRFLAEHVERERIKA